MMPPKEKKVGKQVYFKKKEKRTRVQFGQVEFYLPIGHPSGSLY